MKPTTPTMKRANGTKGFGGCTRRCCPQTLRVLKTRRVSLPHLWGGVGGGPAGVIQLDVSATPRYSKGSLFTWTVFDYPLKQAILDNVTKRPLKGIAQGIKEVPSDIASVRYQSYLTAGVERWRKLSTCEGFPWSRPTLNAKKTGWFHEL